MTACSFVCLGTIFIAVRNENTHICETVLSVTFLDLGLLPRYKTHEGKKVVSCFSLLVLALQHEEQRRHTQKDCFHSTPRRNGHTLPIAFAFFDHHGVPSQATKLFSCLAVNSYQDHVA